MYVDITLKMLVGALVVLIIFRIIGKKAISELTPFDLIYVLILGGLLENAIYDRTVTIANQTFAMVLWAAIVYLIEVVLKKTKFLTKAIQGEPAILIHEGKLNMRELEKNHIDMEQLRTLLRQHGCYTLKDAYQAILEISGDLTVIKKSEKELISTLLVDEGRIDQATLKSIGKDESWLLDELEKEGYTDVESIIYCEWLKGEGLYVFTEEDATSSKEKLDG